MADKSVCFELKIEQRILFQKSISVIDDDVGSLSSKIHDLEYKYYPQIIEKYLLNQL